MITCKIPSQTIPADAPPQPKFHATLSELSQRLGVSPRRIHQIERRAKQKLRRAIEREAAAAGVSPREWLFGDED